MTIGHSERGDINPPVGEATFVGSHSLSCRLKTHRRRSTVPHGGLIRATFIICEPLGAHVFTFVQMKKVARLNIYVKFDVDADANETMKCSRLFESCSDAPDVRCRYADRWDEGICMGRWGWGWRKEGGATEGTTNTHIRFLSLNTKKRFTISGMIYDNKNYMALINNDAIRQSYSIPSVV